MQVVDVIILLMLGMGAIVGFKRGFLRQTVQSIGGIVVVILSFIFMGPLASFLYNIFPFIDFSGIFRGISSLNVLVYQVIAFMVLLFVFSIVLRIIMAVANFIEKVLDATIILAIPSKILGAIMGLVEAYLIIFIILFILTLPIFSISLINNSRYKDKILEGTPIVSKLTDKVLISFKQVYALKDDLASDANRLGLDQKVLHILIDNKIISAEKADELYAKGKLNTR